ncbi:HU family DNA-binding protein, partial [Pseudomonas sp. NPDC088885]
MALTKDQLIADIAEAIDAPKTTARNVGGQMVNLNSEINNA